MAEEKRQKRDALHAELTKIVGQHMPKEKFEAALAEALQEALTSFKIDSYQVREFMTERIKQRAIELLNTTFKDEIDKLAQLVVVAGLASRR